MAAIGSSEAHTVLIVDPSQLEQRYTSRLVESLGWHAVFARDGVEALESIQQQEPAVVLTDLQLPQLDGLQLVQKIRDRFPHVPVVLMTRTGNERLAVAALKAGAADYVPKQSLAIDLGPVLERVLSIRQAKHRRFRVLAGLTRRSSQFVLENDPTLVPPLVSLLREDLIEMGLCDLTGATRAGIALEEALLNAIYHGQSRSQLQPSRARRRRFSHLGGPTTHDITLPRTPGESDGQNESPICDVFNCG
jgi:CheY-like chemotaxis protein